jgi:predicted MPP superfamily phosphohydrolase
MNYKKFIVATDNHGGLVSKDAMRVLLAFCDSWKPSYRIHLGDLWDFSPLRRGASQEEKAYGISDDYVEGLNFLDEYKPQFLTLGNHDDRIYQYAQHCADGMLRERCEELVMASEKEFKRRKITFCEYNVTKFLRMPEGGPKLIHGFRSTVSPAKAHFDNWGSCLHGHCHTVDEHTARHIDGGKAYSIGCMADLDQLSYSDRQPAKLGHRNGFLYGIINTKTGDWKAWQVTKENGIWISPQGIL